MLVEHPLELTNFRRNHPYKRITVADNEWEYIAGGQGEEAVLLLGGTFSVGETAFYTIKELEQEYRILSPSYPLTTQVNEVVEGLAELLATEHLTRVHLFGHSLGAALAHVFVRRYPDKVDKLILANFGLYTPAKARRERFLLQLFSQLPYNVICWYYQRRLAYLLAAGDAAEQPFIHAYIQELLTATHTKATVVSHFQLLLDLIDHAQAYALFTPVTRAGRVLLIEGKEDPVFSLADQMRLESYYPGAEVYRFEQGGHMVGFTHPAELNTQLRCFLRASAEEAVLWNKQSS